MNIPDIPLLGIICSGPWQCVHYVRLNTKFQGLLEWMWHESKIGMSEAVEWNCLRIW